MLSAYRSAGWAWSRSIWLEFHRWDYGDPAYLDALKHLMDLRQLGKIRHLALTNFDTERMRIIVEQGIEVVSNQVRHSIVDRRPERRMASFGIKHGITPLTYSTGSGKIESENTSHAPNLDDPS